MDEVDIDKVYPKTDAAAERRKTINSIIGAVVLVSIVAIIAATIIVSVLANAGVFNG